MWFYKRKISALSDAIKAKNIIRFSYNGNKLIVEPHMLAVEKRLKRKILIAWFIDGHNKNRLKNPNIRWSVYHLRKIKNIEIAEEHFKHSRALGNVDKIHINNVISVTEAN